MREIKFRAWDNVDKVLLTKPEEWQKTWRDKDCDPDNDSDFKIREFFISHEGHLLEHTYDHGIVDTHYYLQGEPHFILMQYTGLKDKKGKEIYEGDIFKITQKPEEINSVTFYFGSWHLEEHGLHLEDWYDKGEIIGNIYENKDLLD